MGNRNNHFKRRFRQTSSPQLTYVSETNELVLFWCGYPTEHHIYYKVYNIDSESWGDTVDWIDESTDQLVWNPTYGADGVLSASYDSFIGRGWIGLAFMTKTSGASPYQVKFAPLMFKDYRPCSVTIEEITDRPSCTIEEIKEGD